MLRGKDAYEKFTGPFNRAQNNPVFKTVFATYTRLFAQGWYVGVWLGMVLSVNSRRSFSGSTLSFLSLRSACSRRTGHILTVFCVSSFRLRARRLALPLSVTLEHDKPELFGSSRLLSQSIYVLVRACLAFNSLLGVVNSVRVFNNGHWIVRVTLSAGLRQVARRSR